MCAQFSCRLSQKCTILSAGKCPTVLVNARDSFHEERK